MPKVYCQNDLCKYYKENKNSAVYLNYGECKKPEVFMSWQQEDEYEVTGHNCECKHSKQRRD